MKNSSDTIWERTSDLITNSSFKSLTSIFLLNKMCRRTHRQNYMYSNTHNYFFVLFFVLNFMFPARRPCCVKVAYNTQKFEQVYS